MVKSYACAGFLLLATGLFPLMAHDNTVAKEMAIKRADRIVASTVYELKDVKTAKVYTSLDNVALNPDIRVNSKYLNWHYTNGVTNMALAIPTRSNPTGRRCSRASRATICSGCCAGS